MYATILIVVSILGIFASITIYNHFFTGNESMHPHHGHEYLQHTPIIIANDSDLLSQKWPGTGSETDPVVIDGLNITSYGTCIEIRNVSSFVLIRNCFLVQMDNHTETDQAIVNLNHTSHITIMSCEIRSKREYSIGISITNSSCFNVDRTMMDGTMGIVVIDCWDGEILCNQLTNCVRGVEVKNARSILLRANRIEHCLTGTLFINSNSCRIESNEIRYSTYFGMTLILSNKNWISNNTIYYSGETGIIIDGCNNTIIKNEFVRNRVLNGRDKGCNNFWDGNVWGDYIFGNQYKIPGPADAVDKNPGIFF